jgi:hypothetical protein
MIVNGSAVAHAAAATQRSMKKNQLHVLCGVSAVTQKVAVRKADMNPTTRFVRWECSGACSSSSNWKQAGNQRHVLCGGSAVAGTVAVQESWHEPNHPFLKVGVEAINVMHDVSQHQCCLAVLLLITAFQWLSSKPNLV